MASRFELTNGRPPAKTGLLGPLSQSIDPAYCPALRRVVARSSKSSAPFRFVPTYSDVPIQRVGSLDPALPDVHMKPSTISSDGIGPAVSTHRQDPRPRTQQVDCRNAVTLDFRGRAPAMLARTAAGNNVSLAYPTPGGSHVSDEESRI